MSLKITIFKNFFPGEVLGALCHIHGPSVYLYCRDDILSSVSDNLERNIQDIPLSEDLQKKLLNEKLESEQEQLVRHITFCLPKYTVGRGDQGSRTWGGGDRKIESAPTSQKL